MVSGTPRLARAGNVLRLCTVVLLTFSLAGVLHAQQVSPANPGSNATAPALRAAHSSSFVPAFPELTRAGKQQNTTIVDPNTTDWGFLDETPGGGGNATGGYVEGPGAPPLGAGSYEITVDDDDRAIFGTQLFNGTRLDALTTLTYDAYRQAGADRLQLTLQLNIDYDLTDTDGSWQGRLVYEASQNSITPQTGVWETFDALAGSWWSSGAPGNTVCPQSNPCTTAEVLTNFPNVGIQDNALGALLIKAGGPWGGGFTGNVDNLVINGDVFDFEPLTPVTNISQNTDHASLQNAIDAAAAGNILVIDAGVLTEGPQIVVDKNLTIRGAGSSGAVAKNGAPTTLQANANSGTAGDARGWILVNSGVDLTLEDLILDATGFDIWQGIRHQGSGTINDVVFQNIVHPGYQGTAVAAFGSGPVDVTRSTFSNIGRIGVLYFGAGVTGSRFSLNTYTGKGDGDFLDYSLDISSGADVIVTRNTISENRGVASVDGSVSAAILVSTFFGPGTRAVVRENVMSNSSNGVFVGFDGSDASFARVLENSFANHTDDNVVSTAATINASSNWHGTADPTAVGDLIDGDIDYTPWFASGTDADPGTPGWQGDYSTLVIDDDSRQVGGVSIFQEGVDLADASAAATLKASANPKVQIADGTYSTATLNKPLDIEPLGTGASVDNLIVEDNVNLIGNDLTVNTLLDITAGAIDATGGPKVVLGPNATVEEDEGGELVVGTTEVTRDAPPGQVQDFGGVGFSIAPFGNDPGTVEVERVVGTAQTVDGTSSILRYYDVTPTNNGGLIATIIFEYQDAELNGLAEADLELFRSEDGGTTWIDAGGTVDAAANTITVGGVDRLSRWTAAVPDPLPVELADFAATVDGETVYLTWNTLSEQSNAGFEVQMRSDAAETWNVLGFVDGFGDTNELQSYAFEATNLPFGALQFRLKQLDYDGQFEYSPVVETVVELAESFVIEAAYPNPFNPQATVRFAVAREQQVTVDLFSVLGQRVATLYDGVAPANQMQVVRIDGSELPSGTYLIRTSGEAFAETQRVVLLK